jgi:hypothetical protein
MILIVLVHRSLRLGSASASETAGAAQGAPQPPEVQIHWQAPPEYWISGRDPMKAAPFPVPTSKLPYAAAAVDVHNHLELKGILCGKDRSTALIGTYLVHEGEEVPGASGLKVLSIDKTGVEFQLGEKRWKQTVSSSATLTR